MVTLGLNCNSCYVMLVTAGLPLVLVTAQRTSRALYYTRYDEVAMTPGGKDPRRALTRAGGCWALVADQDKGRAGTFWTGEQQALTDGVRDGGT